VSTDEERQPPPDFWPEEDALPEEAGEAVPEGLVVEEDWGPDHRSGYVALVGRPNVGKSTLLNAWMGIKLAPVTPKPQTTRTNLLGILTRPDAQLIFVDTPGIHLARTKLGEYMVRSAEDAIPDADVVLCVVDVSDPPGGSDREVAARVSAVQAPVILVLNKIDLLTGDALAERWAEYQALGEWHEMIGVSATEGTNLDVLLEKTVALLPLGPRYYPEEQLSNQQERFVVAEIIREQALVALDQEVPHAVAVLVEDFKEREGGGVYIAANIYTEKASQKGIVIGRGGRMLKEIGRNARREIEGLVGQRVYLDLWVKVRKNWRKDPRSLREFGYDIRDLE